MKSQLIIRMMLLTLFVSLANTASARTPLGRHVSGMVLTVDAKAQAFRIMPENKIAPIVFSWNRQTVFVATTHLGDATLLKNGVRVEVTYREPFFGEAFVTKVTLLRTR